MRWQGGRGATRNNHQRFYDVGDAFLDRCDDRDGIFSISRAARKKSEPINICARCKKDTHIFVKSSSIDDFVCGRCAMEVTPADLTAYLLPDGGLYFNKIAHTLHFLKVGDLIGCGWFLRKWKVHNVPKEEIKYKEEYHFEYYGYFKCPLARFYRGWPMGMSNCPKNLCEAQRFLKL